MNSKNPKVNFYLQDGCGRCSLYKTAECKVQTWKKELKELRNILLETELSEDLKWKQPSYTWNGKNLVMISAFKNHAVLSFMKGNILKDPEKILEKLGENTNISRVIRFDNLEKVQDLKPVIIAYIKEAIETEKSGKKTTKKPVKQDFPTELIAAFDNDKNFKEAFEKLTQGRQRSYLLHYNVAKQSKTKISRIEKSKGKVLKGLGFNEYEK